MTTHTHPEIQADILELSKSIASEIGASENRLRADMYKIKDDLKSDIAGLETRIGGLSARMGSLESDVKAIKDFLLPPKP
jgi:hypothetical protein